MKSGWMPVREIFALAILLASLTAVAWRQSTTRETMAALDAADRELALAADEHEEVVRELTALESRPWIGAEAARRLGMRPPSEQEVVITSGGSQ